MARQALSSGRLKARRRRRRLLLVGLLVFVLVVLAGGLVWLSWAPFMRVTAIEVSGTKSVPTSTLQAYVEQQLQGAYGWLFARNNVFLYPRAGIAAGLLAQYPTLRSVDVHAKDFHTVEVAVMERQPVALWCPAAGGECDYLDEQGLIYAPAPQFNEDPYLIYTGAATTTAQAGLRQYLTTEQFQSLSALVAALETKVPGDPIDRVAVDSSLDARAYFHDGFVLIFSIKDDGGDVFERFSLALQSPDFAGHALSDFEYLDLRFGDKLYYKLKNQ